MRDYEWLYLGTRIQNVEDEDDEVRWLTLKHQQSTTIGLGGIIFFIPSYLSNITPRYTVFGGRGGGNASAFLTVFKISQYLLIPWYTVIPSYRPSLYNNEIFKYKGHCTNVLATRHLGGFNWAAPEYVLYEF